MKSDFALYTAIFKNQYFLPNAKSRNPGTPCWFFQ